MFTGITSRLSRLFSSAGNSNSLEGTHRVPEMNDSSFAELSTRSGMVLPMDTSPGSESGAQPEFSTTPRVSNDIPAFRRGEIKIIKVIGAGSQGRCEKVVVPRLGICVMKGTMDERREELRRREMVFTLMLNHHPNIISFYGIVYHQNPMEPVGFLTEFMSGKSMNIYLRNNHNIDFGLKIAWAKQIALAMSYMHSRGIIHRDLNPNNILIDNLIFPTKIKLCDFGLARVIDGNSMSLCTGTSCYMAPEVIVNRHYDHFVDVFSLAMTLYAIFTEKAPFADEDLSNWDLFTYHGRLTGKMLPEYAARPGLSDDLGDIATLIKRCWSTEPSQRDTMDTAYNFLIERYGPLRDI